MKKRTLVYCLALFLWSSGLFARDVTEAECVEIMKRTFVSPQFLPMVLKQYPGLSGEKAEVFQEYFYWLGNNEKFLRKLAHDFNQTGLLAENQLRDIEETKRLLQASTLVATQSYYQIGLLKGSPEDLREFLKYELRLVSSMPYGYCKKYHFGLFDAEYYLQTNSIRARLYRALSLSEMRAYFLHFRKMLDNAVDDRKTKRELNPVTLQLATKAIANAIDRAFEKLPKKKWQRLNNALVYPESATDKDACEAGTLALKALYSLDGQPFVLATTYLLGEIAK